MQEIGPIPVMTARLRLMRSPVYLAFDMRLHTAQRLICNVVNEEIADDFVRDRKPGNALEIADRALISTRTPSRISLNVQTTRMPFVNAFK